MMRNSFKILVTLLILLMVSCDFPYYSDGDYFFVEYNNAVMPVWVKGNEASDKIILFIHGGPGGSAIDFALVGFEDLEEQFQVAYWDQPASGQSQGNYDVSKASVEDFSNALDNVVITLEHLYAKPIVLYGVSWGAGLGTAYVTYGDNAAQRQSRIESFVYAFGTHDFTASYTAVRPRIITSLQDPGIEKSGDSKTIDDALSFYQTHLELTTIDQANRHQQLLQESGLRLYKAQIDQPDLDMAGFILFSPINPGAMLSNPAALLSSKPFLEDVYFNNVLNSAVISIPLLVIAGEDDLQSPKEPAIQLYNNATAAKKQYLELAATRHFSFPSVERKAEMYTSIIDFINQ